MYSTVLEAIVDAAKRWRITLNDPRRVMTDFERGIISSVKSVLSDTEVSLCTFHLGGQSLYRKLQGLGLQTQYDDPNNRDINTLRIYCLLWCSCEKASLIASMSSEVSLRKISCKLWTALKKHTSLGEELVVGEELYLRVTQFKSGTSTLPSFGTSSALTIYQRDAITDSLLRSANTTLISTACRQNSKRNRRTQKPISRNLPWGKNSEAETKTEVDNDPKENPSHHFRI